MIVLYFFTNGERASSLNCKRKLTSLLLISNVLRINNYLQLVVNGITCDMCSAAATLGFTTSQFAITSVFGTLPSV